MKKVLCGLAIAVFGVIAWVFVVSLPVMLLWNALIPQIFGLCPISYVQSLGLTLLCNLLLGKTTVTMKEK